MLRVASKLDTVLFRVELIYLLLYAGKLIVCALLFLVTHTLQLKNMFHFAVPIFVVPASKQSKL